VKRAFRLTAYGDAGIMAAESHGQAKFRLFRELQSIGYNPKPSDIRVRRAPEHDAWALTESTTVCWAEQYLPGRILAP
jgi:hypothetical protein